MMKLVLLLLFCRLCFGGPSLTHKTITALSGKLLYYENSTSTFICKESHAIWKINGVNVSECNCPGKCGDIRFRKNRITTYCNGSRPVLHYKQMKLDDNYNGLKCSNESSQYLHIFIGRRTDDFYPKDSFALVNNSYTLVCEKKGHQWITLFDDKKVIARQTDSTLINKDYEIFDINSDQSKITLRIKKVALKDDGKIFGCYYEGKSISLLKLTVHVIEESDINLCAILSPAIAAFIIITFGGIIFFIYRNYSKNRPKLTTMKVLGSNKKTDADDELIYATLELFDKSDTKSQNNVVLNI